MTLLSQLNFNFDPTKFGSATNPDGKLQTRLGKSMNVLSTATSATYTTVVAGNVSIGNYFVNPLQGTITTLYGLITRIHTLLYNVNTTVDNGDGTYSTNYFFQTPPLATLFSSLTQELTTSDNNTNLTAKTFNSFISHTDRLSNISFSNAPSRPDFNTGRGACQNIQKIIYQNEPSTDSATIEALGLGCFSSLFIGTDLTDFISTLIPLETTGRSLLLPATVASQTSQMTTYYNQILNYFTQINNLVVNRRTADENFYVTAQTIAQNVNKVNQLSNYVNSSNLGDPVQTYLVNHIVGASNIQNLKKS